MSMKKAKLYMNGSVGDPVECLIETEEEVPSEFIVFADGYMSTSTLPAIQVPKITNEQLDQIITAKTQGKLVLISTEDGTHDVVETCLLEGQQSFKIFYCNYLVEYVDNGSSVIAEYVALDFQGE